MTICVPPCVRLGDTGMTYVGVSTPRSLRSSVGLFLRTSLQVRYNMLMRIYVRRVGAPGGECKSVDVTRRCGLLVFSGGLVTRKCNCEKYSVCAQWTRVYEWSIVKLRDDVTAQFLPTYVVWSESFKAGVVTGRYEESGFPAHVEMNARFVFEIF